MRKSDALRILRERADLNQMQVANATTNITQSRLSLIENHFVTPSENEIQEIRDAIVLLSGERFSEVAHEADPRLEEALKKIAQSPSKSKVFDNLQERGFSELEAAIAVLGRNYPAH